MGLSGDRADEDDAVARRRLRLLRAQLRSPDSRLITDSEEDIEQEQEQDQEGGTRDRDMDRDGAGVARTTRDPPRLPPAAAPARAPEPAPAPAPALSPTSLRLKPLRDSVSIRVAAPPQPPGKPLHLRPDTLPSADGATSAPPVAPVASVPTRTVPMAPEARSPQGVPGADVADGHHTPTSSFGCLLMLGSRFKAGISALAPQQAPQVLWQGYMPPTAVSGNEQSGTVVVEAPPPTASEAQAQPQRMQRVAVDHGIEVTNMGSGEEPALCSSPQPGPAMSHIPSHTTSHTSPPVPARDATAAATAPSHGEFQPLVNTSSPHSVATPTGARAGSDGSVQHRRDAAWLEDELARANAMLATQRDATAQLRHRLADAELEIAAVSTAQWCWCLWWEGSTGGECW